MGLMTKVGLALATMLLGGALACNTLNPDPVKVEINEEAEHARGFAWTESEDGHPVLAIRHPRTLSWLATVSRKPIERPIQLPGAEHVVPHVVVNEAKGFVTSSTTHVHLLEAGAGLKGWKGCKSLQYLKDDAVLDWAKVSEVRDVRSESGWNAELMTVLSPGWIAVGPDDNLTERSWPLVPIAEYLETTPLGRAEWMIPMAWMAGDSAAGANAFQEIQEAYLQSVQEPLSKGKRVFTGTMADGVWYAPGSSSFVAEWIRDAGGEYSIGRSQDGENVALGLESMLQEAHECDAWVVMMHVPEGDFTLDDFKELEPHNHSLVEATEEVWLCNTADADYFGALVPHPERVLQDLADVMSGKEEGRFGLFTNLSQKSRER